MKRTVLAVTVMIVSIAVFSFLCPKFGAKKEYNQDKPTRSASIKILNFTEEKELEKIVGKALKVLEIKNINVVIIQLSEKEMEEEETLMGYIEDKRTYYLIKIRPRLSEDYYLDIISHEMIHLYDMHSGRLKQIYYGFMYDGLVYQWHYPYWQRPYEIKAFENEEILKFLIISNPPLSN